MRRRLEACGRRARGPAAAEQLLAPAGSVAAPLAEAVPLQGREAGAVRFLEVENRSRRRRRRVPPRGVRRRRRRRRRGGMSGRAAAGMTAVRVAHGAMMAILAMRHGRRGRGRSSRRAAAGPFASSAPSAIAPPFVQHGAAVLLDLLAADADGGGGGSVVEIEEATTTEARAAVGPGPGVAEGGRRRPAKGHATASGAHRGTNSKKGATIGRRKGGSSARLRTMISPLHHR